MIGFVSDSFTITYTIIDNDAIEYVLTVVWHKGNDTWVSYSNRVLSFNVTHTLATGYSRRQRCNLRVDVPPASVRVQFLYSDSYASVTFRRVTVGFLQSILPVQLDRVMRHFAHDRWWRPLGSYNKPQYVPLAHTIRVCCALLIKYAHY